MVFLDIVAEHGRVSTKAVNKGSFFPLEINGEWSTKQFILFSFLFFLKFLNFFYNFISTHFITSTLSLCYCFFFFFWFWFCFCFCFCFCFAFYGFWVLQIEAELPVRVEKDLQAATSVMPGMRYTAVLNWFNWAGFQTQFNPSFSPFYSSFAWRLSLLGLAGVGWGCHLRKFWPWHD